MIGELHGLDRAAFAFENRRQVDVYRPAALRTEPTNRIGGLRGRFGTELRRHVYEVLARPQSELVVLSEDVVEVGVVLDEPAGNDVEEVALHSDRASRTLANLDRNPAGATGWMEPIITCASARWASPG